MYLKLIDISRCRQYTVGMGRQASSSQMWLTHFSYSKCEHAPGHEALSWVHPEVSISTYNQCQLTALYWWMEPASLNVPHSPVLKYFKLQGEHGNIKEKGYPESASILCLVQLDRAHPQGNVKKHAVKSERRAKNFDTDKEVDCKTE